MAIRVRHGPSPIGALRMAYQTGVWSTAAQRKLIEEQRRFQAGQAAAGRRFQAGQAGMGRALQREGWDRQTAEAEAGREAQAALERERWKAQLARQETGQEAAAERQAAQQKAVGARQRTLYEDLMPSLQEQEATRQLEAEAAEREREREEEWFDQLRRKYPREFDEAARAIGAVLGEEGLGAEATENALGQLRAKYPVIDDTAWDMLVRQRGQMGEPEAPFTDWAPAGTILRPGGPTPPNHYYTDDGALLWVNPETGESVEKKKAPEAPKPEHAPVSRAQAHDVALKLMKEQYPVRKTLDPKTGAETFMQQPGALPFYWGIVDRLAPTVEQAAVAGPGGGGMRFPPAPEEGVSFPMSMSDDIDEFMKEEGRSPGSMEELQVWVAQKAGRKIKVRLRETGEVGMIEPKDFDPETCELVEEPGA